ncbi:unnamed protein product, partial [Gongylonema pulchrum]|uniref:StAR related lipid transfer domain containing 13 n=1 Tax=Gongylonema pulchrum TaxID=637853 RepID=A0A183EEA7_9BILA
LAAIPEDRVSLSSSSTLLETLPPSPSQFGKSQDGRYFSDISERCVASQPEGFESEKVITVRRARSDSDVFQDSPSVSTSGDQLNDSLLDVTIHETQEPNDSACEAGGPDQSANVAPLTAGDLWETAEGEAGAGQKHHHRLSRLAEALKKRMAIKCSDLAMWKREPQSQQPVHKITLSSVTEQWGICWSMGRCMADLADVHIIDSEPLRKLEVISAKSKNHKENENESTEAATSSQHSEHMLPDVYTLYHPLPKLNIQIGEVFLAPRYYR